MQHAPKLVLPLVDIAVGWGAADCLWSLAKVSQYSCKSLAPTTVSVWLDLLFCGLVILIPGPLIAHWFPQRLCVPFGTKTGSLPVLPLCPAGGCATELLYLPLSRLPARRYNTSLHLLFNSPSNLLTSVGVSAFCAALSSHLHFSNEWLLLPPCY